MIGTAMSRVEDVPRTGVSTLARRLAPPAAGARWWRLIRWPIALLFVGFGVIIAGYAIATHREAATSESWPTTFGSVTETTIREGRTSSMRSNGRRSRARPLYTPHVRYEYAVDGNIYQGDRIAVDDATYRDYDDAAAVVARYPAGATVTVSYDPERPERTVLEVGGSWGETILGLLVGVGAAGGGLLLLRFGHLRPLRSRPTSRLG